MLFIAVFKTYILLLCELLKGTCHIREYAVHSTFLYYIFKLDMHVIENSMHWSCNY